MLLMPSVATLAAAGTEQGRILLLPAWTFGAGALGAFILLLGVLWFFRNTATKYDTPVTIRHDDAAETGDLRGSSRAADPGEHH
jgi:hypothetical protein